VGWPRGDPLQAPALPAGAGADLGDRAGPPYSPQQRRLLLALPDQASRGVRPPVRDAPGPDRHLAGPQPAGDPVRHVRRCALPGRPGARLPHRQRPAARPRLQGGAARRAHPRRDREPGFQPGGVRRAAGHHQRAVRNVLPRETAFFHRERGVLPDAGEPVFLTPHRRSGHGAADDRQGGPLGPGRDRHRRPGPRRAADRGAGGRPARRRRRGPPATGDPTPVVGWRALAQRATLRRPGGAVVKVGRPLSTRFDWDRDGVLLDRELQVAFEVKLVGETKLQLKRTEAFELYNDVPFDTHETGVTLESEWLKWLAVGSKLKIGSAVNHKPAAGLAPFLGDALEGQLEVTFRPAARLRLDHTFLYQRLM